MMKALFASLALCLALFAPVDRLSAQGCQYILEMHDQYGDGWFGGQLTVNINGVETVYTGPQGYYPNYVYDTTVYININPGDAISLSINPGSYVYEVSYELYSADYQELYNSPTPVVTATNVFSTIGFCPTCAPINPSTIDAAGITSNSANISWTDGSTDNYNLQWGPTGFEPGSGQSASTSNNLYTLTGLNDGVTYDVYVQVSCGPDDVSSFVGPYTFKTISLNPLVVCNADAIMTTDYLYGWSGSSLLFNNGVNLPSQLYNYFGPSNTLPIVLYQNVPATFVYDAGYNEALQENSFTIQYDATGDTTILFTESPDDLESFTIIGCPTCAGPSLAKADPQSYNAYINWQNNGGNGTFFIEVGEVGFTLGSGSQVTKPYYATSAEIENLQPNSFYDAYVWLACANDSSQRLGPITFKTLPTSDVGIAGLAAPVNSCNLSNATSVIVRIKNYGGTPQSLINFRYSVNGVLQAVAPPQDGLFTGVISNDSLGEFSFDIPYNFAPNGQYNISAWTELANDANTSNDTLNVIVYSIPSVGAPSHIDFEDDEFGWVGYASTTGFEGLGKEVWEYGTPDKPILNGAYSGDKCWVTKLDTAFTRDGRYYLESNCFDLSAVTGTPSINLAINYETGNGYDGAFLEVSTDGGLNWNLVGEAYSSVGTNWYNGTSYYENNIPLWSGQSFGWKVASHPLTGLAGQSNVRFRMAFTSHFYSYNQLNGFALDDIWVSAPVPKDLAVIGVGKENSSECGTAEDHLIVTVKNFGTATQTGFNVGYETEDGTIYSENVGTLSVAGGATINYTFDATINTLFTQNAINAWVALADDFAVVNDTFAGNTPYKEPRQMSYKEDFEATTYNLPIDWLQTSGYWYPGNYTNNTSYALGISVYNFSDFEQSIVSPTFGPISLGNSLKFDYRLTTLYSYGETPCTFTDQDYFIVDVSDDCGISWDNVFEVNATNQVVPSSPIFTLANIDLSSYDGKFLKIRFRTSLTPDSENEFFLNLDNINVEGCPGDFNLEANIIAENGNQLNGSIAVEGETGNEPLTFLWSNGATTATVVGLANGDYSVTITDDLGCVETASYSVSELTGTNENNLVRSAKLAPNPTDGLTNLLLELATAQDVTVDVVNVVGNTLFQTVAKNTLKTSLPLDLQNAPAGVYFVRIQAGTSIQTLRLMKQ